MKLCAVCGMPILVRRRTLCGPLCAREWKRSYLHQYLQNYPRKPLTEEQKKRSRERQRLARLAPEYKEKRRAERKILESSPDLRAKIREQRRKSYQRRKDKIREFRRLHPEIHRAASRKRRLNKSYDERQGRYLRRNALAWQILKELGFRIDLNTLEVSYGNGTLEAGIGGSTPLGAKEPDGASRLPH